ncbi:hypothetical protein CMQ_2332 [Grosmannia clavigera kw1407]|uniref:Uncharacterized protein n=1 Tax=Grosmannia clavigera (strain kw1407 / UAMH 11150) TaxID=655863 RepID=F0XJG0_GROCL|nr:uncharacterized protein CMQ_2332 [Grosmannia clavigera kw1407]EFX02283.1 hypothetical protein CMQ_2332 [Grosmannia clavigera kw1407]
MYGVAKGLAELVAPIASSCDDIAQASALRHPVRKQDRWAPAHFTRSQAYQAIGLLERSREAAGRSLPQLHSGHAAQHTTYCNSVERETSAAMSLPPCIRSRGGPPDASLCTMPAS